MNQSTQPSMLSDQKIRAGIPEPIFVNNITNPPQITIETSYRPTQMPANYAEQPRRGWFAESQKNKPQSQSMTAASLIFMSNGMSLTLSIGFGPFVYSSHILVCWFIAAILGSCISALFAQHISIRKFNFLASVLVILNGVLLIVEQGNSETVVILARYCDGIAFGLTVIPIILAGSEQSVKRNRGAILGIEQLGLAGGGLTITVFAIYIGFMTLLQGTLSVIYGLIAFVMTFFLTRESPVFLLRKNNEIEAVDVLRRLQNPKIITDETYALLNENKALLEEDMSRGTAVNISNSLIPMVKMILFRCFVTMTYCYPLSLVFLVTILVGSSMYPSYQYFYIFIYVMCRMFGVFFSYFLIDTVGRRTLSTITLLALGVMLIVIGSLDVNYLKTEPATAVMCLLFVYQFISGVMAPVSTCYLSEAFSISVKPYFILTIIIAENILQIIICCVIRHFSATTFCFTLGGLQIAYGIVFYFIMPETKQTTLRQALEMFQTTYNGVRG